jgi:hypothetical protein
MGISNKLKPRGLFTLQHFDEKGVLKNTQTFPNGVVDEGAEHVLETEFRSGAPVATWYLGLINNASYTGLADADVMASHAGWLELVTYTEAARPAWTPDAAATRAMTNGTTVDFSINATCVIRGVFLTSNATKSGTTGILWATALLTSVINAGSGDTIKLTYTIGA